MKRNYVVCCGLLLVFFTITLTLAFASEQENSKKIKTLSGREVTMTEMDEFIKSQMDSLGIPGMSIAVINDAKIVYYRVLGVSNIDTKEKVNDETLFDAGSMTKTPFAFLVMKMVEKGILNLDQPLYTYLPYPDIAYDERYKLITARMVLCHTSGFPNWRIMNKDQKLDIKFTPGTQYLYSGEGFEYLANVAAHLMNIQKNDLQDLFVKEVAAPLGMQFAYFVWSDYVASHQATSHFDNKVSWGWGLSVGKPDFGASYSLQTEAMSYSKFIIAIMQEKGLNKETYNEMLKPQVKIPSRADSASYCLGIETKPSSFDIEYMHDGYNRNFSSAFMFNKEQKFGYVFFTNSNKGTEFEKRLELFLKKKDVSR